ncbi:MAG: hypothetical protein H7Y43_12550 [Akkermansiaceae bacterium]|nr:hypothetical protein [Verrucomicrobiales bacterium]
MAIQRKLFLLAAAFLTLAQTVFTQPAPAWRVYQVADGLPENACASVTIGLSGNVIVRHANTNLLTVLNGYDLTILPAPMTTQRRIHESPGGQLWAAASSGLLEFQEGNWVSHPVAEIEEHFKAGGTNEIPLLPVRQGLVLILLPNNLLQFNAETPSHLPVPLLPPVDLKVLGTLDRMSVARDGKLWISGSSGFARSAAPLRHLKAGDAWSLTNSVPPELETGYRDALPPTGIPALQVFDTALEPGGALWLATSAGLLRRAPQLWQPERQSPTRPAPERAASISADQTIDALPALPEEIARQGPWKSFLTARNGDLWLGGANVAWRHRDDWRIFTSTNQLGPEAVIAFAEASDGRIWCATPNKVWEFDGREWLALRGGFGRINSLCRARDGTLWVATDQGVHRCTRGIWIANGPEDGLRSVVVSAVIEDQSGQITAFTAAGSSVFNPDADIDAPRTFIRPPGSSENSFREGAPVTISFGGVDKWKHTAARQLQFSCRLDEREWAPFQELESVSFADLSAGKHYFQVRAMDRNGNIDPRPARLEFIVALPWYKETRLVVILSAALVVALFFAGVAFNRHRQLLRSYAEVEAKIAERTRQLEAANRELLHSQKMNALGTIAAGIAHDFNNILSIVKGSAQIIEENVGNPGKIRTRVDRIKTVVDQGSGIVKAMLGFSRESENHQTPCEVNLVVEDTLKLLGDRFLREAEVNFTGAPELPEVAASKDFIQQILLNFIFNAAEAMTGRRQIVISTERISTLPPGLALSPSAAKEYVAIRVQDFGSGIAPEILPRIFEPFFTTKALSTRRGTGLGLSMAWELARKLEAGLTVESAVNQGSTFSLILPAGGARR